MGAHIGQFGDGQVAVVENHVGVDVVFHHQPDLPFKKGRFPFFPSGIPGVALK